MVGVRVASGCTRQVMRAPAAHSDQHQDARHGGNREPSHTALAQRQHNQRRQQWTNSRAGIAAHLEKRLGESMLASGGKARNARGLRMEDGRTGAHHGRSHQQ
jgi:hypothetical protein